MSENMMPELTLTPDDTAAAAAVEVPSLTLTPEAPEATDDETTATVDAPEADGVQGEEDSGD